MNIYLAIPTPVSGLAGALALGFALVSLQRPRGLGGAGLGPAGIGAPVVVFGAPRGPGGVAPSGPIPPVLGDLVVSPRGRLGAVSYTHLTLPTICSV